MSMRTCPNGHRYNKSSDCPTCPHCERSRTKTEGWLTALGAPARRALEQAGINTLKRLAQRSEQDLLALHGIGPASMPVLRKELAAAGLQFKGPTSKSMTGTARPMDTDAYLDQLQAAQRKALQLLRKRILAAAPGAEEHFGYGMPAFKYNGHPMLYIGAARNHCALYGSVPAGLKEELKEFKVSKGAIQFTPDKPLPAALVKAIVKMKCAEIDVRWPKKDQKMRK
jgi:uncharacterized protein YdhG (YjbR/CyaY superfamily)